jgi:hypothetical protein
MGSSLAFKAPGTPPEIGGSNPSCPAIPRATVVVLGARNEIRLDWLRRRLDKAGVLHVPFYESDYPYAGQLMSIGLLPGPKEALCEYVKEYQLWPLEGIE